MKYEYKTIPSHPNFEICDYAPMEFVVRSIKTKRYAKVRDNGVGYPHVYLGKRDGGDEKDYYIHRLVAETYIGPIPEGMECDHIDTNPGNYNHNNIRICTPKENRNNKLTLKHNRNAQIKYCKEHPEKAIEHSKKHKEYFSNPENRKKQSEAMHKLKKWVQQIDKNTGEILNEYFGMSEAGRQTGIIYNNISECCNGKRKTAGGYLWRYKK